MPCTRLRTRTRLAVTGAVAVVLAAGVLAAPGAVANPPAPAPVTPGDAGPDLEQVRSQVATLREDAGIAAERYNDARLALQQVTQVLAAAQERETAQVAAVAGLQRQIGRMAAEVYKSGAVGSEFALLLDDDPSGYLDQAGRIEQLSRRNTTDLATFTAAQRQLTADRLAVADRLEQVRAAEQAVGAQRADVEGKLERAEATLARLTEEQRRAVEAAQAAARQVESLRLSQVRASRSGERTTPPTPVPPGRGAPAPAPPTSGTQVGTSCGGVGVQAPDARVAAMLQYACAQLGKPYSWGASGPGSFDCSGFTMASWASVGVGLPHSSRAQAGYGTRVSRDQIRPGDLVFSYSPISHVGIYLGNGTMIHAPNSGGVVEIKSMQYFPFSGAARL